MCLPIDCWLCTPRTDDDQYHTPANKHGAPPPALASRGQPAQRNGGHHYNGNGGHHYNGNSYPAHGAAAGAEADRKASNDVRRGPGPGATRGWQGHAATGAQEKTAYPYAGADETLRQPPAALNGKVAADGARGGGGAHNYYYSYEREQPPAHRDAADSHYPAATATADHESPSEALGGE